MALPLWKDPEMVGMAKELVKNLLVFGLAFYLVFGVLRPILRDLVRPPEAVTPEGEAVAVSEEAAAGEAVTPSPAEAVPPPGVFEERLRQVKEFAKQNPKLTAEIIKQWMAQP